MSATTAELGLDITRRFNASPEDVFDAWTSPKWCEWLGPAGFTCAASELDVRVGGSYLVRMNTPDGRPVMVAGRYLDVSRPHRLVMSWKGDYHPGETVIQLAFSADGSGTLMHFQQTGFLDAHHRDSHFAGWTSTGGSFDKLEQLLAA